VSLFGFLLTSALQNHSLTSLIRLRGTRQSLTPTPLKFSHSFLFVDYLWINTFIREGLGMAAAAASVQALGVTSISLPGMDGAVLGD
jgi:hypothetical protein